jgi:spore coat protein CotF
MLRTQELLKDTEELHQLLIQAGQLAEKLQAQLPEVEEPAIRAQASVLRAFINQIARQEDTLTEMIRSRSTSNGHLH